MPNTKKYQADIKVVLDIQGGAKERLPENILVTSAIDEYR